MKKLLSYILIFVLAPSGFSHPISDGEDLGASIRYIEGTDIQAVVRLKPRHRFDRITVGLGVNNVGGPRVVCEVGAPVVGQQYECLVSGDVAAHDPGLLINVLGFIGDQSPSVAISRKTFTVLNPDYDRMADRRVQSQQIESTRRNIRVRQSTKSGVVK